MSEQFDIIFRGDIVFGHKLADVKTRLQQLFKTDAAKIDTLFTGRPVPLKRNLDLESAQKYRDALIKAGAQVELSATAASKPESAPAQPKSIAESRPAEQKPAAAAWTLAPVGSNLLTPTEKPAIVERDIDTSSLSLRAEGGNLLDASEQQSAPIANVIAPNLDIAEVGADLITAEEKMELPFVEIDLEDWTIAEAGSDLIDDLEKQITPIPVIHVPDIGLAPAGSDLGQLKSVMKPVNPDISGIRLAD